MGSAQQLTKKYGSNGNPSQSSSVFRQQNIYRSPQNEKRLMKSGTTTVHDKEPNSSLLASQIDSDRKQTLKNQKSPQNQESSKLSQNNKYSSLFKQHAKGFKVSDGNF